jgi:hypothetical protein
LLSQNPSYPQWTLHCTLLGCQGIDKDFGGPLSYWDLSWLILFVLTSLCVCVGDTSDRIYYAWCHNGA